MRSPGSFMSLTLGPRFGSNCQDVSWVDAHVDVWVADEEETVAIELKYLTRGLNVHAGGEAFELLDQAAQDLGRYDIVKDVWRIETLVAEGAAHRGVTIALTNDSAYWTEPRALASLNYDAFRLHDGRRMTGTLAWGPATGAGTMRGREAPIALRGAYRCLWTEYSRIPGAPRYGAFRYLLFDIR
jgi:hypothetical protein